MSIVSMLLLLSGDIETNPGPHESNGENKMNLQMFRNVLNEPSIVFSPRSYILGRLITKACDPFSFL